MMMPVRQREDDYATASDDARDASERGELQRRDDVDTMR